MEIELLKRRQNRIPSPANADKFRPVIEALLTHPPEGVFVSAKKLGVKPSTLHVNFNEALRWFILCSGEPEKYTLLRAEYTCYPQLDGILIRKTTRQVFEPEIVAPTNNWKQELIDWFQKAEKGATYDKFLKEELNSTEIKWLLDYLAPFEGVEIDLNNKQRIRILR